MTEQAVKELLRILERNVTDTGTVLDGYEATHDDAELSESRQYNALLTGHYAMIEAIGMINKQLNKALPERRRK